MLASSTGVTSSTSSVILITAHPYCADRRVQLVPSSWSATTLHRKVVVESTSLSKENCVCFSTLTVKDFTRKVETPATHSKLAPKCELHRIIVFSADWNLQIRKEHDFENEYKLYLFSYSHSLPMPIFPNKTGGVVTAITVTEGEKHFTYSV